MKPQKPKPFSFFILVLINLTLAIITFRYLKITWQEYKNYTSLKQVKNQNQKLIKQNQALQQQLILINDPFYKEYQARRQLAVGFPGEKTYLFPKPTFTPPPLKTIHKQ